MRPSKVHLLLFLLLIALSGCYLPNSFKVNKVESRTNTNLLLIANLNQKFSYLILHEGDSVWHIENASFGVTRDTLTGILSVLPAERYSFKHIRNKKVNRKVKGQTHPFDELHIYVSGKSISADDSLVIVNSNILFFEVYQKVKGGGGSIVPLVIAISLFGIVFGGYWLSQLSVM